MKWRLACLSAIVFVLAGGDLLACGDKFLVGSRGTRYQRPKNVRAASVVIYAAPSSEKAAGARDLRTMLDRRGDRVTTAETLDQLSAILSSGRFDVVLAASDAAATIQQLVAETAAAAAVVAIDTSSTSTLLAAIDKAVQKQDRNLGRK